MTIFCKVLCPSCKKNKCPISGGVCVACMDKLAGVAGDKSRDARFSERFVNRSHMSVKAYFSGEYAQFRFVDPSPRGEDNLLPTLMVMPKEDFFLVFGKPGTPSKPPATKIPSRGQTVERSLW